MKNSQKAYLAGGALVAVIAGAVWYYEKQKPAPSTGPAPVQTTVTLSPGNVVARVNGMLTLELPSGGSWQSVASGNLGTVTLPVGFGTPVTLPSSLFASGPITFQWVDSSNHVQTSVVSITG